MFNRCVTGGSGTDISDLETELLAQQQDENESWDSHIIVQKNVLEKANPSVKLPEGYDPTTKEGEIPYHMTENVKVGQLPFATRSLLGFYNIRGHVGHRDLRPNEYIDRIITNFSDGGQKETDGRGARTIAIDTKGNESRGSEYTAGYKCTACEYREGWIFRDIKIYPTTRQQAELLHGTMIIGLSAKLPVNDVIERVQQAAKDMNVPFEVEKKG